MVLPSMWARPCEALSHLTIAAAVIVQYLVNNNPRLGWLLFGLHCVWIAIILIGAKVEGLRIVQCINGFVFLIWSLYYFVMTST